MNNKMHMSRHKTLGDLVSGRENNFDLLRLILAFLVLIPHSFHLTGYSPRFFARLFGGYDTSVIAVSAFFIISGFLISGSLERRSLVEYFLSRMLRIIPALAVVVIVTVFVIGPIFTSSTLVDYFSNYGTYQYLRNIIPYETYFFLPGVFNDLPLSGGVNGSLWTIPIEFFCYLALPVLFFLGRRTLNLTIPVLTLLAIFQIVDSVNPFFMSMPIYGTVDILVAVKYGVFFLIGSAIWANRYRIPFNGSLAIISFSVLVVGSFFGHKLIFLYCGLPYVLVYFAYFRRVFVGGMRKLGDVSYGAYLFAFPIQQSLIAICGGAINPWALAVASGTLTVFIAWISWRYIEKPAIMLKSKILRPEMAVQPQ
ncbi:acyltransferase family protein [Pseudomonas frederiksbergensis]|uniref:acyltransferase family protein n=1 Tax=Pseudomonas frederiksbergensis TaxID=104087 RepID=UPI003D258A5F